MKRLYVMAERSKSICTPSRDEELYPLPEGKWCKTLKEAFYEAEIGNLIGYFLGWEKHVYLLTAKKWIQITKVTEQMIYEDELHEALEGLKASYYVPAAPKFRIIMKSEGGTKRVLFEGIETEFEACNMAENLNWEWKDENDFVWDLYVEEDE